MGKSKLVLIDGNAVMHRAYHALPGSLTTKSGEPINAVYGFVSMLLRVIQDLTPTHLAVCFDRPEPTFRKQEYKEYQSQRPEMEDDLSVQFEKVQEVLAAMEIPVYSKAGYEADDVIGTISKRAVGEGVIDEVVIVTGDRDILQLVNGRVRLYMPAGGLKDGVLMDGKSVVEKLGVMPEQIVDYKGLVGDPSDNYPGVAGIGPKTAVGLIGKYGTVENIYEHLGEIGAGVAKKLEANREGAEISKRLAKIVTDVDVEVDWKKMGEKYWIYISVHKESTTYESNCYCTCKYCIYKILGKE